MNTPQWTRTTARLVATAAHIEEWRADAVLDMLATVGLLVVADYERPTAEALYGRYSQVRMMVRAPWRWVMCRETHDWMAIQYANAPHPGAGIPSFTMPGDEMPPVGLLITPNRGEHPARLMDVPIRLDPAARRIMIELVGKGPLWTLYP